MSLLYFHQDYESYGSHWIALLQPQMCDCVTEKLIWCIALKAMGSCQRYIRFVLVLQRTPHPCYTPNKYTKAMGSQWMALLQPSHLSMFAWEKIRAGISSSTIRTLMWLSASWPWTVRPVPRCENRCLNRCIWSLSFFLTTVRRKNTPIEKKTAKKWEPDLVPIYSLSFFLIGVFYWQVLAGTWLTER